MKVLKVISHHNINVTGYVNACLSHCLNPFVLECVTFQMYSLDTNIFRSIFAECWPNDWVWTVNEMWILIDELNLVDSIIGPRPQSDLWSDTNTYTSTSTSWKWGENCGPWCILLSSLLLAAVIPLLGPKTNTLVKLSFYICHFSWESPSSAFNV